MKQGKGEYGRANRDLLHLSDFLSLIKDAALIQKADQFWNACMYYWSCERGKKKKYKECNDPVYPLSLSKKPHSASPSAPKSC